MIADSGTKADKDNQFVGTYGRGALSQTRTLRAQSPALASAKSPLGTNSFFKISRMEEEGRNWPDAKST